MKITSSRARRLTAFITFIAWLVLVVWFWDSWRQDEPFPYQRLLAVVLGLLPLIPLIEKDKKEAVDDTFTYDFDSAQHRQNRENIIANVKSAYSDGVLRHALHNRVRIELQLEELPQALQRPLVLYEGQEQKQAIGKGASIDEVFVDSGRALLILGAPGSGKTITLLELCDSLLGKAEAEAGQAVPVVLNLSTWAEKQQELADWIVYEMQRQYQLATKVTPAWLAKDHICLLLDGLDEVRPAVRSACVQAINRFRETHNAPVVVCSRIVDYEELSDQLNLSKAITIQPLEKEQIKAYLTDKRLKLTAVYQAVKGDDALRALSETPLMLNIMTVVYRGYTPEQLRPILEKKEERRKHLYNAYIKRVFERRPLRDGQYSTQQALQWLRFLAGQLTRRDETQFFIEDLQPGWLPVPRQRRFHVLSALLFGLGVGLLGGLLFGLVSGLVFGLLFGLVGGLGGGGMTSIKPVDELVWQRPTKSVLVSVLVFGLLGGLVFGLLGSLDLGLGVGLLFGLVSGLVFGLVVGLFVFMSISIKPVESKRRNQPNQGIRRTALNSLRGGLVFGLVGGLIFGLVDGLSGGLFVGDLFSSLVIGLISGLVGGLGVGLLFGLVSGLVFGLGVGLAGSMKTKESRRRNYPNQGIRRTAINAFRGGLFSGLFGGLVVGLGIGLIGGLVVGLGIGLIVVLVVGLFVGLLLGLLEYGGSVVIQHYVLRGMLQREDLLPLRIVPFLDGMAERILVQQAGAHYRFVHRTLQEHIAALSDAELASLAPAAATGR